MNDVITMYLPTNLLFLGLYNCLTLSTLTLLVMKLLILRQIIMHEDHKKQIVKLSHCSEHF